MPSYVIVAVLLAALLHASWNALVKSADDHLLGLTGLIVARLLICAVMVPFFDLPDSESWLYLGLSAMLHLGYYIGLSEAYKYGDFAQAYPIARGSAPILVAIIGVVLLEEKLGLTQFVSLFGVIIGIFVFNSRNLPRAFANHRTVFAALITSTFIGFYTVADGIGGRYSGNVPAYLAWLSLLDGLLLVAYTSCKRGLKSIVSMVLHWRIYFFGAILSLVSYMINIWAMTQAPIALVSVLRETSIVIAALIGMFYFKEPAGIRRIMASLIIFVSVLILGLG